MYFKRGFLNRPDAFGKDHSKGKGAMNSNIAATGEVKEARRTPNDTSIKSQKLYEMPRNFLTMLAKGPNAPPQRFRGPVDDPLK
jgi:hypothetical protein